MTNNPYPVLDDNPFIVDEPYNIEITVNQPQVSQHCHKQENQWEQWQVEVIPSLIAPYMELLHLTNSLRDAIPLHPAKSCTCGGGQNQNILLVKFDCEFYCLAVVFFFINSIY